jgi:hypothetical protein
MNAAVGMNQGDGTMKLYRGFLMVLVAGAFAVIGCGSSGGGSASEVCDACDNQNLKGVCESAYNTCLNVDGGGHEECVVIALATCGI